MTECRHPNSVSSIALDRSDYLRVCDEVQRSYLVWTGATADDLEYFHLGADCARNRFP